MKKLAERLWNEPAVCLSALAGAAQVAVFWPDWRAACTAAVTLLAGGVTRQVVTPTRAKSE